MGKCRGLLNGCTCDDCREDRSLMSGSSTLYDRNKRNRSGQQPLGASGHFAHRDGRDGHSTQWYPDNSRTSWDTDGNKDYNEHSTQQGEKRKRNRKHW